MTLRHTSTQALLAYVEPDQELADFKQRGSQHRPDPRRPPKSDLGVRQPLEHHGE
jgi:hypothetical protein